MDDQRMPRLVGLTFLALGFLAIIVGWRGAARVACVDCQLPYLLSGGAAGLGLLLIGSTMLVLAELRATRAHVEATIQDALGGTSNGRAPMAVASGNGHVVAAGSTYHLPDCRLVVGKRNVVPMSPEEAASSELSACRICRPQELERPRKRRSA